jgi:hypothetical protein
VVALSRDFQQDAYQVTVGSLDLRANVMIKQIVEVVTDYEKYARLCDHLKNYNDGSRVLIFVETKKGCDQLTRSLQVCCILHLPFSTPLSVSATKSPSDVLYRSSMRQYATRQAAYIKIELRIGLLLI